VRTEACVCGGTISAQPGLEPEAVAQHNMSLTHVVWRSVREGPTALDLTRDVSGWRPRASVPLIRKVS
jgi:hypothetical protein